jgi:hypothetical protein
METLNQYKLKTYPNSGVGYYTFYYKVTEQDVFYDSDGVKLPRFIVSDIIYAVEQWEIEMFG